MKIKFFSILIILLLINDINSQTVASYTPKISNIPSSPEAALLSRFGDIPVSYYTGTADISIPIYTIQQNGIEIPIVLRYNSSGIKVEDEATWVGLGWDLSLGGAIIQQIRGKKDEEDIFYTYNKPTGYNYLKSKIINYGGSSSVYKYLWHCCYNAYDELGYNQVFEEEPHTDAGYSLRYNIEIGGAQPDIYVFNFGRFSGKFYINFDTGQIEQIDKKDDIIFEHNSFGSFQATTQDGVKYLFNVVETAYNYDNFSDDSKSGKTYRLGSIHLTNGEHINFTYIDINAVSIKYQESKHIVANCSPEESFLSSQERVIHSTSKILTKISTPKAIINFILEDRDDIPYKIENSTITPKRLQRIDVVPNETPNQKIKSFLFNYSYFPYNSNIGAPNGNPNIYISNPSSLGKRLRLDSVREIGIDESGNEVLTKPAYKFEYDLSNVMPLKTSYSKDFWGYYNGVNNSTLLPDLRYFNFESMTKYKQHHFYLANGQLFDIRNHLPFVYNYVGANRYTDKTKAAAYMLKKIIYPTGGRSEFEYESNSFANQFIPDKVKAEIAFKNFLIENNGQSATQTSYTRNFTLTKSTTILFNNNVNNGYTPYNNPNAPIYQLNDFGNSRIILSKHKIQLNGQSEVTILKQWSTNTILNVEFETNHGKNWSESIRVDYDSDPSVYYRVEVVNELNYAANDTYHIAGLKTSFNFYDDTGVDTTISYGCGVRIKSVKNFLANGLMESQKQLKYSGGKLLNNFEPLSAIDKYCNVLPGGVSNGEPIINTSLTNTIFISSDGIVESEGNPLGYTKVEEIELGRDNGNIGKKEFFYINNENVVLKNCPSINNYANGLVSSEIIKDFAGNIKIQKDYHYEDLYSGTEKVFFGVIKFHLLSGVHTNCWWRSELIKDYLLVTYPIVSSWYKLKKVTTREYFGSDFLLHQEDFTYNEKGNVKTASKNNSENETLLTKYYYATDFVGVPGAYGSMVVNNMTDIVLKEEQFLGSLRLSSKMTVYGLFGSLLLPQFVYASKGDETPELKLTYNLYDNKGNVLQYTLENGTPISFKWDDLKNYIVRKGENVIYSQINNSPINLPDGFLTNYTHKPLIGLTSMEDPKGDTTYFSYDPYGALNRVKDKDGNLISEYQYNYLPQN